MEPLVLLANFESERRLSSAGHIVVARINPAHPCRFGGLRTRFLDRRGIASVFSFLSLTMKQASFASSIVHGGGKRRAALRARMIGTGQSEQGSSAGGARMVRREGVRARSYRKLIGILV